MLTEDEIRHYLAKMKDIVARHKAPDAPLASETITIDGQELNVFSKVPANLGELYALGANAADRTFLVYQDERFSFA